MKKTLIILVSFTLLVLGGYCFVAFIFPLQLSILPESTILLDTRWQRLGETVYSGSVRHQPISSEEIPDFYKKSLVALEDQSFYDNNGISLIWLIRSTLHNIQAEKVVEWGTTLSSGLIRNSFWIGESRSFGKKILEFLYAIRLNHLYSKDRILTEYIDRVSFGNLNYGLKSAARYYFDREPKNLTRAEQIALLIIPKDSKKYDPYKKPKNFRIRFESVVQTLEKEGIIMSDEWKNMLQETLVWNTDHTNPLPYVSDFLQSQQTDKNKENSPLQSTFDLELTEQIDAIAKNTLREIAWKNVGDYGILVAERPNPLPLPLGEGISPPLSLGRGAGGEGRLRKGAGDEENPLLRVMIGGNDYSESTAGQVNTTLALRQPGSTIKPFTYALAFEKLGMTPESTILDLPIAYKTEENYAYEPKNYSQSYKGEITLRQALSESVNIPAIKLAEQVSVPILLDFLRWLGITSLTEKPEHYGLGLTLGNGEISLFELLQAYTIFTDNGNYCPFQALKEHTAGACIQKIDKKYTDMIVSILSDRYAKIGDFPLNSALDFGDRNVSVKTGTSRNFRDNWAIGFTDHYMIGIWTGNKSGENMKGVTGATGAGEIFRRIVYALEQKEQSQIASKPLNQKQEYLIITNPLDGSLYKKVINKDTEKQKIHLHFETNLPFDTSYWLLDGEKITDDFIDLVPGDHTIEIILMRNGEIIKKERNEFNVE